MNATPVPLVSAMASLTRTSARATKVSTFLLETWSRLVLGSAPRTRDEQARELSWVGENFCALHGLRVSVHGRVPTHASVLVANHITYFDPLLVASLVPCIPLAKREVSSWPFVGELARRMGVLWVQRHSPSSGARVLREAMRALAEDVSVLVFPEGTTTRGTSVLPFKRGMFGAALRAGVPVVPVAIHYERADAAWVGDQAFVPHYVRSFGHACTRVSVRFLEPLSLTARSTPEQLAETARVQIQRALSRASFAPRAPGPLAHDALAFALS